MDTGKGLSSQKSLTRNLAVLKDQFTSIGPPHSQFIELLSSAETRHTLQNQKEKQATSFSLLEIDTHHHREIKVKLPQPNK